MMDSVMVMLIGGLIRVLQGFAAAAPTLLVGLLIAAILRFYLGDAGTRRLFGGQTMRSLPQAWLVGMLLPVCSIGVLPILRQMHRAGVRPGALSAFALSAPLFNPLSLLYGLTLSRPLVIILFAIGSLLVVTFLGILWDAIDTMRTRRVVSPGDATLSLGASESTVPADTRSGDGDHLIGLRRLVALFVHVSRDLTGMGMVVTLGGLLGLALLAAVLPFGAMQSSVERDDVWAPVTMTAVALPVYATPMLAMSQLGMMFQHANSPGAAFVLLILGTGMNLATPLWFARHYGTKATATWLVALVVTVLGIAYAVNRPLIPPGVDPAGHTHAFDIYANPISSLQTMDLDTFRDTITRTLDVSTVAALALLGLVAVVGVVLRLCRVDQARLVRNARPSAFASSLVDSAAATRRGFDRVVPPAVIGGALLGGLVMMSVVACFAYYPSSEDCLAEINHARGECLSAANSGHPEHALHWLPVWEEWSRRLEVGTFLRSGHVRPYQRMQGYLVRKKLELLEHELEHDPYEPEEVRARVRDIYGTNGRWVRAFQRRD